MFSRKSCAVLLVVCGMIPNCGLAFDDFRTFGLESHWAYYNGAGRAAFNASNYVQAEKKFGSAIAVVRPFHDRYPHLLAKSFADLARTLHREGRDADGEPLARWSLGVRETRKDTKPSDRFQGLYVLALLLHAQKQDEEAMGLFQKALAIQEQALGPEHHQVALTLDKLASCSIGLGKTAEADALYQKAIAMLEKNGASGNSALSTVLQHYAAHLRQTDRPHDAEAIEARLSSLQQDQVPGRVRINLNQPASGFESFD